MEGMRYSEEEGGGYVLDDDDNPLYEDWGAPSNITVTVNSGEDSLYDFMQTLDDYNGVEDWNRDLEKEFGETWFERPLVNFFKKVIVNEDGEEEEIPMELGEGKAAGMVRWASFIRHFNLKNVSIAEGGEEVVKPAPFAKESIYFLPDCSGHELAGRTGGENFGVLAKTPALVH